MHVKGIGKMLVKTKNNQASRVLLSKEFTKGKNSPFKTVKPHKKFSHKWWKIRSFD